MGLFVFQAAPLDEIGRRRYVGETRSTCGAQRENQGRNRGARWKKKKKNSDTNISQFYAVWCTMVVFIIQQPTDRLGETGAEWFAITRRVPKLLRRERLSGIGGGSSSAMRDWIQTRASMLPTTTARSSSQYRNCLLNLRMKQSLLDGLNSVNQRPLSPLRLIQK